MNEANEPTGTSTGWTPELRAAHEARAEFTRAMKQDHFSRTDAEWHVNHFRKTVEEATRAEERPRCESAFTLLGGTMNHTPTPWKLDRNWHVTGPRHNWETYHPTARDSDGAYEPGQIVCHVNGPSQYARSDFQLIAAAPELLKALKAAKRDHEEMVQEEGCCCFKTETEEAIELAIAKAEGKTQE